LGLRELVTIDPPINPEYSGMEKECWKFLNSIPRETSSFISSTLHRNNVRLLIGLPTSPTHVYLAHFATTGKYDKSRGLVIIYYISGYENLILRTLVHEVGHVYFEQKSGETKDVPENIRILLKVIDESIPNYFVLRYRCDESFIKYIDGLINILEKHIIREGAIYQTAYIIAPRLVSYALYQYGITEEDINKIAKDPLYVLEILMRTKEEKLRKAIASVLYSVGLINEEGLKKFGYLTKDYKTISIGRLLELLPEENLDNLTIKVFMAIAGLIKLAITLGREKVYSMFKKIFEKLRRIDFVHNYFQVIFSARSDMLGTFLDAIDATIPGTLDMIDSLSTKEIIELVCKTFGLPHDDYKEIE